MLAQSETSSNVVPFAASALGRVVLWMQKLPKDFCPASRLAFWAVASYAHCDGTGVFANVEALAERSGLPRSTFLRGLADLTKRGVIVENGWKQHASNVRTRQRYIDLDRLFGGTILPPESKRHLAAETEQSPTSETLVSPASETLVSPTGETQTYRDNSQIELQIKNHAQPAEIDVERVCGELEMPISLFQEETDILNEPIPEPMERTIERIPEKTKTLAASKAKVGRAPEATSAPIEVIPKKMEFQDFWDAYPRKTGKLDAERKFIIACRRATAEQIMDGVARYQFSDDPKFIPHPATWLHQGRYLDVQVDLSADQYGLTEWHAAIISDGKLSAAMYDPDDLRPILIATGWEPSWRGSLDVLSAWMRDGYVPDSVAKTIASAVAEFGARGNLAAFDKRVRYRAERISL